MQLGEKLAALRQDRGLTQKEVADMLNCHPATISGYECGSHDPSYDTLTKYAKAFDVTVDYLLGVTDIPFPLSRLKGEFADGVTYLSVLNSMSALQPEQRTALLTTLKSMQFYAEASKYMKKKGDKK